MNHKINLYLCLILLLLCACRRDEGIEQETLAPQEDKKIVFFENYEKDKNTKYKEDVFNIKDTSNPAVPFVQSLIAYLKTNSEKQKEIEEKYGVIGLAMSSEVFTNEETGQQVVFFPIIDKEGYIIGVISGLTDKKNTYLAFRIYEKGDSEFTDNVIKKFANYLFTPSFGNRVMASCGDPETSCHIQEVIIVSVGEGYSRPIGTHFWNPIWGNGYGWTDSSHIIGKYPDYLPPLPTPVKDSPKDKTPCGKVKSNNAKARDILNKKNITEDLDKAINEKSFTFGKDKNGIYQTSAITEGVSGRTAPFSPTHKDFSVEGGVHTHTPDLYSAHSVGDIYTLYKANNHNTNFMSWFTFAVDGIYFLSIIDRDKFRKFNEKYPEADFFDIVNVDWKEGSPMKETFDSAFYSFLQNGLSENSAFTYATVAVLKKYDMGLALSKQENTGGNFIPIYVNEVKKHSSSLNGGVNSYKQTEDCNL